MTRRGLVVVLFAFTLSASAQDIAISRSTAVQVGQRLQAPTIEIAPGVRMQLLSQTEVAEIRAAHLRLLQTAEQRQLRRQIRPLMATPRPPVLDNIAVQTPVRNQGGRGTCATFAAVAALEAAYKRAMGRDIDLSEQHANWVKNVVWMSTGDDPAALAQNDATKHENLPGSLSAGVSCVGMLRMMQRYFAVSETSCPYVADGQYENFETWPGYSGTALTTFRWWDDTFPQQPVNAWNFARAQLSSDAWALPSYGVRNVVALTPDEFHNPAAIEALVASGKDIVFAMNVYSPTAATNPRDPVWRHQPGAQFGGGHCMLIVGYDRNRRFFVVKNSYGPLRRNADELDPQWRDVAGRYDDYVLLDYDYLADVIEAGYIDQPVLAVINFEQRMLGSWDVTFTRRSTGEVVSRGTLYWRQAIAPRGGAPHHQVTRPSYRIGDLVLANGAVYRVNGEMRYSQRLDLFVDFDRPAQRYYEHRGVRIEARRRNREVGVPALDRSPIVRQDWFWAWLLPFSEPRVLGVPISDLEFSATWRQSG